MNYVTLGISGVSGDLAVLELTVIEFVNLFRNPQ